MPVLGPSFSHFPLILKNFHMAWYLESTRPSTRYVFQKLYFILKCLKNFSPQNEKYIILPMNGLLVGSR